jgi:hypothetical protein
LNDIHQSKIIEEDFFLAICEALRWWLSFDGPQTGLVQNRPVPGLTKKDVRNIAFTYNFSRNLSAHDDDIQYVAHRINAFFGRTWDDLDSRAAEIEAAIADIREHGGRDLNLVSGTTKLSWFVSPTNWTPFDRLAAQSVKAKHQNTVKRMRQFYAKLDDIAFLPCAKNIEDHLSSTLFSGLGGCRVLDKYLMLNGEEIWASGAKELTTAFVNSLPDTMKIDLLRVGEAILSDPSSQLDLGAIK